MIDNRVSWTPLEDRHEWPEGAPEMKKEPDYSCVIKQGAPKERIVRCKHLRVICIRGKGRNLTRIPVSGSHLTQGAYVVCFKQFIIGINIIVIIVVFFGI